MSWSNAGKIAISLPFSLPQLAFMFTSVKVFNQPIIEKLPEIISSRTGIAKAIGLIIACEANATWFGGLMENIISNDNIFPAFLNSRFGIWCGYFSSFSMGLAGLLPIFFPTPSPEINLDNPKLDDVIQYLEKDRIQSDKRYLNQNQMWLFGICNRVSLKN